MGLEYGSDGGMGCKRENLPTSKSVREFGIIQVGAPHPGFILYQELFKDSQQ